LHQLPIWQVSIACAELLAVTVGAFLLRRRRPYLLAGWLWYLGMLIPVIGIVQVGIQARADRFTYLPQIGLLMAITWWAADLAAQWRLPRPVLCATTLALIAALSLCAQRQTKFWRDGVTLFTRIAQMNPDDPDTWTILGNLVQLQGRHRDAISHLEKALAINPNLVPALRYCGIAHLQLGEYEAAAKYFDHVLKLEPSNGAVMNDLGMVWFRLGRINEAATLMEMALRQDASRGEVYNCLGLIRTRQGRFEEALTLQAKAVAMSPDNALWRVHLAIALYQTGKLGEATTQLREATRLGPDDANVLSLAALVAATAQDAGMRSATDAVAWSEQAVKLTGAKDPVIIDILAASYAEAKRFDDAVKQTNQALSLANSRDMGALAKSIRAHQSLYQSEKPLRVKPADLQP